MTDKRPPADTAQAKDVSDCADPARRLHLSTGTGTPDKDAIEAVLAELQEHRDAEVAHPRHLMRSQMRMAGEAFRKVQQQQEALLERYAVIAEIHRIDHDSPVATPYCKGCLQEFPCPTSKALRDADPWAPNHGPVHVKRPGE